jgi:hypothetical protein
MSYRPIEDGLARQARLVEARAMELAEQVRRLLAENDALKARIEKEKK